jgi:hypothetical protein
MPARLGVRGGQPSAKLQRLRNSVLRTIGNLSTRTLTLVLHRAFQILYVHDYIKIRRKKSEVIQTHDNVNVRNIGRNEAQQRKYKTLELGGCQA